MAHFKAILRRFNKVTQSSNEGVMAPCLAGSLSSPGMEHAPRGDRIKALKYNIAADSFTLKTLRYNLFAQAAYLTTQSRQSILKLTSAM